MLGCWQQMGFLSAASQGLEANPCLHYLQPPMFVGYLAHWQMALFLVAAPGFAASPCLHRRLALQRMLHLVEQRLAQVAFHELFAASRDYRR